MRLRRIIALAAAFVLALRLSAQTPCDSLTVPLREAFDTYGAGSEVMPPCWFATRNYDMGYPPHVDALQHYSGTASLVLYPGTLAESHYSMVIAPPLAGLSSLEGLYLRFRLRSPSTSARLLVGFCADTNRYTRAFEPIDTLHVDRGSTWQEFAIDLSSYTGNGRRLAFCMRRSLQPDGSEMHIDDVSIESCGTSVPWVSHLGSDRLTLHFDVFGMGIVDVRYGQTVISPAQSPLVITGLEPEADYTFSVGCTDGHREEVMVRTLERVGMVPAYYETFSLAGGQLPPRWRTPLSNHPQTASGVLRMMPATGDSCLAVLPTPVCADTHSSYHSSRLGELTLALSLGGSGDVRLVVGAMEFAGEPEGFTPIDTLLPSSSPQLLSLAPYIGTYRYPALLALGNGTLTVDNLRLAHCLLDNARLYNITEEGVTVEWDTLYLADSGAVQLEYGPAGFTPGSGSRFVLTGPVNTATIHFDGTRLALHDLSADTEYDLYLWPTCGDLPADCDRHRFRTFAHEVIPPYCTGFEEGGALPQGWVGTAGVTVGTNASEGSRALSLANGAVATMPLMGDAAPDTVFLEFYAIGTGSLIVGRQSSPYDPFVPTDTLAGTGVWSRYSVALASTAGSCLALRAVGGWNVDALALRNARLLQASVGAISAVSARIDWLLQRGDSVHIEYAPVATEGVDFTPGHGTSLVSDTAVVLANLASGTPYCVHVSPLEGDGCHYRSLWFTTLDGPVTIPYCQSFNTVPVSGYPPNWRRLSTYGEYPIVSTVRNLTGGRSLQFAAGAGAPTVAVLPDALSCAPGRSISFYANLTQGLGATRLVLGFLGDVSDLATFTPVDTVLFTSAETWLPYHLHVDSVQGHLALMLQTDAAAAQVFVENLAMNTCAAKNVRLAAADSTSITLTWQSDDSLTLHYTLTGGGELLTGTITHSPAVIDGLVPGANYIITLLATCSCGDTGAAYYAGYGPSDNRIQRVNTSKYTAPPSASIPYCVNFESLPTGRTPSYCRGMVTTDRNYHGGSHAGQLTGGQQVVLPPINDVQQLTVSLWLYGSSEALMAQDAFVVGVMDDPDSLHTFVPLDTLRLTQLGVWQHRVADLSAYVGTGRYIVMRTAAAAGTFFMDDLSVARYAIGDVAVTSAGVATWRTWHDVSRVAVEYGPAGFEPGTGTADTVDAPLTTFAVPGVVEGSNYDLYLKPISLTDNSCQRLMFSFGSAMSTPYCENFDDAPEAGMPYQWAVSRTYSNTPALTTAGGTQVMQLRAAAGNRSIVVLPLLAADSLAAHQLTLSLRTPNHNRARLVVGQIGLDANPNSFQPRDTLVPSVSNRWHTLRLPLTRFAPGARLALACEATVQTAELLIDTLAVTHGLTPSVAVLSARRIELRNTDTDYYIEYGPVGFLQGQGTVRHVTDSLFRLENLTPGASYWLYCRHDATPTCLAPLSVTMPTEESLPYCRTSDTVATLVLPEFSVDSVSRLHLYFSLRGGNPVEVGVLQRDGDWSSFESLATVNAPVSTWVRRHVSLATYQGDGRFVALRTTDGGNAQLADLTVLPCELPSVSLTSDNRAVVSGSGAVEYGPAGFTLGSGTTVRAPDTVILANNTLYDFHLLCDSGAATCTPPQQLRTAIDRCPLPDSLTVSQPGNGRVILSWPSTFSGFWLEYAHAGAPLGSGVTIPVGTPPLTLVLDPDTAYNLYLRCDSAERTARPPQRLVTLSASVALPYCSTFDSDLAGWRVLVNRPANYAHIESGHLTVSNYYGTTYLVLPQPDVDSLRRLAISFFARFRHSNGHTLTLGAMSDASDPSTFDSLASFTSMRTNYTRCFHSLADYYGGGRFLALRVTDDDVLDLDDLLLSTCAAYDMRMTAMETDHVEFQWQQLGNPTTYIILYSAREAAASEQRLLALSDTLPSGLRTARVDSLSPLTDYVFYISYLCDGACDSLFAHPHTTWTDTFYTFTPQGGEGCIDYTDLHASYVTCAYGSYLNPMEHQGSIDYGYLNGASRHTVHIDTAERDARTGGLLRTIPPGEHASVRLGNWITGGNAQPQAESITYGFTVDAADADLLVLRYAAVLQDPEHSPSYQPRFRLEILNQQGQLIDSCAMADFIADASLGWAQAPGEVLWKDWTTVGVDLTPYDGQTVFVRLTTHDCGEGSHFGYAYFTLRCASKRMQTEGCSVVPDNRFTVPSGFVYRWYSSLDTTATISDSSSLWVRSDNSVTYYCRLSFIDNPQCHFTMSAFAGARYPLALFDTVLTVANCEFDLRLQNRSTISGDGVTPLGTGEPVETLRWILPGGAESSAQALQFHLDDTVDFPVTLIAGIADDQCTDTLRRTIHVRRPYPAATLEGPDERCINAVPDTLRVRGATAYQWASGATGPAVVSPSADTVAICYTVDTNGCPDTLHHSLIVHSLYLRHYADTLCSSAGTYPWLDTVVAFPPRPAADSLAATLHRLDRYGCDSTMTLALSLLPSYQPFHRDTVCADSLRPFFDTLLATSGIYVHPDTTLFGCDSTVTLDLTVMPLEFSDEQVERCDSLRWYDGRLYLADTVGPTHTFATVFGCDSTVTLHLTLHHSTLDTDLDTFCTGQPYLWRDHTVGAAPGTVPTVTDHHLADTLATLHGCDSVLAIDLTEMPLVTLAVDTLWHCSERTYTLEAHSNVPYVRWMYPVEGSLFDRVVEDSIVTVAPARRTTYYLYADYHPDPLCPVSLAVTLQPLVPPQAEMRYGPSTLSAEQLDFEARDVSRVSYPYRYWYINGELQPETSWLLQGRADDHADTVGIMLVVSDGHCADTALALIPVQRSGLFIPNAFTPGLSENSTFGAEGVDIAHFEMSIYDRRGILVFHTDNLADRWNGLSINGETCPAGAYIYLVRYADRYFPNVFQTLQGTVLLIR